MEIYACPMCGSKTLIKKYLYDSPITYVHESHEIYVCKKCGWEGIPISFRTEKQYKRYVDAITRNKCGDS
jgi:DNA-directed RNA polymerase subunit RPC12/RpoP